MSKLVKGKGAWTWAGVAALLVIGVWFTTQAFAAAISITAEPLQNAGDDLTNSTDYSAASAVVTRHESSDLTLNGSDQVTSVTVEGTKVTGVADVKVDLLDTSGTILDTKTVSLASASGTYSTNAAMTLANIPYFYVAEVKAVYTATASGGGEIAIYREATATDAITTTNFDRDWDTVVTEDTGAYNLNVDNKSIELQAGRYLVLYGARFDSTSGSNRSEVQSQLVLNGADLPIGWSQGFMRRSSGADELFTSGGGIIQVATDNDPLILRSYRTDDNSGGVARVANATGIQLLKLYDGWNVLRLSKATTQAGPTGTTFVEVTYDQQDEINTTDFGHTSGSADITLKTAGHYIVFANTFGNQAAGTSTAFRSQYTQKLTLNGSDIDGTHTTLYLKGSTEHHRGCGIHWHHHRDYLRQPNP